jgi:hypothetical protein
MRGPGNRGGGDGFDAPGGRQWGRRSRHVPARMDAVSGSNSRLQWRPVAITVISG